MLFRAMPAVLAIQIEPGESAYPALDHAFELSVKVQAHLNVESCAIPYRHISAEFGRHLVSLKRGIILVIQ
jgi:hypothetical protein